MGWQRWVRRCSRRRRCAVRRDAMGRLPMRKVRDVLRLTKNGHRTRQVAAAVGISSGAVAGYLQRARAAEMTWERATTVSDGDVEAELFRPIAIGRNEPAARAPVNFAHLHRELVGTASHYSFCGRSIATVQLRGWGLACPTSTASSAASTVPGGDGSRPPCDRSIEQARRRSSTIRARSQASSRSDRGGPPGGAVHDGPWGE